jgi:uncharacterized protein YkwD/PKD repeat protein
VSDGSLTDSETVTINVNEQNQAPELTSVGPKTITGGSPLSFTISASDPDGDSLTYSASGLPSGANFNPSTRSFSWTPSVTQAGTYQVTFRVSDGSLTDSETVTITVSSLNQAPILSTIGSKSVAEESVLSFTISATDSDSGSLTYSATGLPSGASFNSNTRTFSWTPSSTQSGSYQVTFRVSDGSLTDSETVTITVSSTNRAPVFNNPMSSQTVAEGSLLTFTVNAADPDGDALTYRAVSLPSGATFVPATRIFSWTPTYSQAGSYTANFSVTDGSLTDYEAVTITVTNVNQAPILNSIGAKTVSEGSLLSFTLSATDPDGNTLTYSAGGVPTGASFNANTRTFSWTPTTTQSGSYQVTFTVTDGSLADSENVAITVSDTAPAPSVTGDDEIDADEQNLYNLINEYRAANGKQTLVLSTKLTVAAASWSRTMATENNMYHASNWATRIRNTGYSASTALGENVYMGTGYYGGSSYVFSGWRNSAGHNANMLSDSFRAIGVGKAYNPSTNAYYWTIDLGGLNDGDNILEPSGTPAPTPVPNRAPVLSTVGSRNVAEGSLLSFTVSATDSDGDSLTYSATGLPTGASFNANTRTFSWTPSSTQAGSYQVTFRVTDGSLTDSETITISVTDLNHAPVLSTIGSRTVGQGSPLSFTVGATDQDGDSLTYSATGAPVGASFNTNTRTFSWTPSVTQAGTYQVTFRVTDGSLTDSETVTITVSSINHPPVLGNIGSRTVAEESPLSFTINATDSDGDSLTYSATGVPSGAGFNANTRTFSWTPSSTQSGTYPVTFQVTDGSLTDSEIVTITVTDLNHAPVLSTIGSKTVAEGSSLSFTVGATDSDGDSLTYSASDMPSRANFNVNTRTFSWTPSTSQDGTYQVTFRVTDGSLSDSKIATITVSNLNHAPVLSTIGFKNAVEGSPLSFTVRATDQDGDSLTYSATGLPTGASFNASVRTFSWTPSSTQSGTHTVNVTVTDGSLTDYEVVTIRVADLNHPPVLSTIGSRTVSGGSSLSFRVEATDPDGDSLTYSATGLPMGALFNANTRTFSWRPSTGLTGTYQVAFQVTDGLLSDTEAVTITVTGTNHAPILNSIEGKNVVEGSSLSFTVSATDSDGDTLIYSMSGAPNGAVFNANTRTFSWTPSSAQSGTYQVTFRVTDGSLSDTRTTSITVSDLNQAPVLTSIGSRTVTRGNTLTIPIEATDPDSDSLTYSASGVPNGARFSQSTRTFTWSPYSSQVGTYQVTFRVSDETLSDTETVTIKVLPENQGPELMAIGDRNVKEGSTLTFTINATDPEGDLLTCWATNLPAGATFDSDSWTFSWTPAVSQAAIYSNIRFTVSDGRLAASENITITVIPRNTICLGECVPTASPTPAPTTSSEKTANKGTSPAGGTVPPVIPTEKTSEPAPVPEEYHSLSIPGAEMTRYRGEQRITLDVQEAGENVQVFSDKLVVDNHGLTLTVRMKNSLLSDGSTLTGTVRTVLVDSESIVARMTSRSGKCTASFHGVMNSLPENAGLKSTVSTDISSTIKSKIGEVARENNLGINSYAYAYTLQPFNLQTSIPATISMSASQDWVLRNGGRSAIRMVQMCPGADPVFLDTKLAGYDQDDNLNYVAETEEGACTFVLVATREQASSRDSPSGGTVHCTAQVPASSSSSSETVGDLKSTDTTSSPTKEIPRNRFAYHTMMTSGAGIVGSVMVRRKAPQKFDEMLGYILKVTAVCSVGIVYWIVSAGLF